MNTSWVQYLRNELIFLPMGAYLIVLLQHATYQNANILFHVSRRIVISSNSNVVFLLRLLFYTSSL